MSIRDRGGVRRGADGNVAGAERLPPRVARPDGPDEPLRLVFVTATRSWTGGERCMTTVAAGLARRGHDVVLTYDPRGPVGRNAHADAAPVALTVRGDADPAALVRLVRLLRRRRPHVVCTNRTRELHIGGLAARLARTGRVVRRFGGVEPLRNEWRPRLLARPLLDVVIRDCEWGCRQVRRANPWFRGPVLRARNGVDVRRLAALEPAPRDRLGAAPDEVLIAALGRVEPEKGSHDLAAATVRAVRERAGVGPMPRLVYIGAVAAGIERRIRERVAEAGGAVGVSFLGARPPDEALRLTRACDILAHPSRADSLCYALLEGMALGLPVVASDVGGLSEVVADGETGRLVPPGDTRALAAELGRLLSDPALRRRLGAAGRRRVAREFDEERMLDEYEAAFRRVAGRAPGAWEER